MATLTKKNEKIVAPFFKNGVTLQFFEIDFGADVSAKLEATTAGARSPVTVALEAIAQVVSIEVIGTVQADSGSNAGQLLRIAVAAIGGAYGADTYDGTNSETMAEHLEDLVKAAGTHQSVNLGSATVNSFTL
jgi:hypothetical protein